MPFLLLFKGLFDPKTYIALANFLAKNWKVILGACLLGVVLYQNMSGVRFFFGFETVPALKKDIVILEEDAATLKLNNKTLSDTINDRNEEIDKWSELTDKLEAQMVQLEKDIADIRTETDQEVDDILNQPTPQTCEKAIDYLREGVEDLSW